MTRHRLQLLPFLIAGWLVAAEATTPAPTPPAPTPPTVAAPSANSLQAYELVYRRNIFDPRRRREVQLREQPAPPVVQYLELRGTLVDRAERVAFFEGAGGDYVRTLGLGGEIAGFRVDAITTEKAVLLAGNETIDLAVGARLQKDDQGRWQVRPGAGPDAVPPPAPSQSTTAVAPAPTSTAAGTSAGVAPAASASDLLKRLQERRQREMGNK